MTGPRAQGRLANDPAGHFARYDPEQWAVFAAPQIAACALVPPGICANPYCSAAFVPARAWSKYCCDACARADESDMRRIGHKIAPALLAWRAGKNRSARMIDGTTAPTSPELRALSNAARAYVTRVQSEWYADRMAASTLILGGGA